LKPARQTRELEKVTSYSRQDVLRILDISPRQLQAWERAGLMEAQQGYSFQDLGQLRTLRLLRDEAVPAASIRHSIVAMRAVAGMNNPLVEATLVRTGTRIAFRHHGAVVDPIRRQLLFDFERFDREWTEANPEPLRRPGTDKGQSVQDMFLAAVQAEETGDKQAAAELYEQIVEIYPDYAPAQINLGTIYFHMRQYGRAEQLYRRATQIDPNYVLAFFDLGNVLDELGRLGESIEAYKRAVELAPQYADAHYNLALAHERLGERRPALRHWQAYVRLDRNGPWADHARGQIHRLLGRERLSIAWRAEGYVPRRKGLSALELVGRGEEQTN
jgi:tetratricopeptide (TPR) repeat protein